MTEKTQRYLAVTTPYLFQFRYFIVGGLILMIFAFATLRIDSALRTERDENTYSEQALAIKKIEFNIEAIERIRALENSGAKIDSNINTGRTNPFQ